MSLDDIPVEWLCEAAVDARHLSFKLEFRDGGSGTRLQVLIGDHELLGNESPTMLWVDSSTRTRSVENHLLLLLSSSWFQPSSESYFVLLKK